MANLFPAIDFLKKHKELSNMTPLDFLLEKTWEAPWYPLFLRDIAAKASCSHIAGSNDDALDLLFSAYGSADFSSEDAWKEFLEWKNFVVGEFVPQHGHSILHDEVAIKAAGLIFSAHAFMGMCPKKIHEVTNLAFYIREALHQAIRRNLETKAHLSRPIFIEIFEIGCGYGYLLTYLALLLSADPFLSGNFRLKFIGYDKNARTVERAKARFLKIVHCKAFSAQFDAIEVDFIAKTISDLSDLVSPCSSDSFNNTFRLLLTLHGCGDLSADLLRSVCTSSSPWNLSIFCGCCYHRLSEWPPSFDGIKSSDPKNFGFPLSKELASCDVYFGKYLRNLACQSPFKDAQLSYASFCRRILNVHYYGSLFHIYCIRKGITTGYAGKNDALDVTPGLPVLGSIASIIPLNDAGFSSFVAELLGRAFPKQRAEEQELDLRLCDELLAEYGYARFHLTAILLFQRWMGYILEQLVLLDRLSFLKEFVVAMKEASSTITLKLVKVFDPILSPRNNIIVYGS